MREGERRQTSDPAVEETGGGRESVCRLGKIESKGSPGVIERTEQRDGQRTLRVEKRDGAPFAAAERCSTWLEQIVGAPEQLLKQAQRSEGVWSGIRTSSPRGEGRSPPGQRPLCCGLARFERMCTEY